MTSVALVALALLARTSAADRGNVALEFTGDAPMSRAKAHRAHEEAAVKGQVRELQQRVDRLEDADLVRMPVAQSHHAHETLAANDQMKMSTSCGFNEESCGSLSCCCKQGFFNYKEAFYKSGQCKSKQDILNMITHDTAEKVMSSAPKELKRDRKFVLDAMAFNYHVIRYVPKELTRDRKFMLDAVAVNWRSIGYASRELTRDRKFMLDAVAANYRTTMVLPEELTRDLKFMLDAVAANYRILYSPYFPEELKVDKAFMLQAARQDRRVIDWSLGIPLAG